MQKVHQTGSHQSQRLFSASEVAEFEYCPLTWWHEQFESLAQADSEELFAELVALEHEHGAQAPNLPEYQMIEQLLLRQGAFEEGIQQHAEHADDVADLQEERIVVENGSRSSRVLIVIAILLLIMALLLMAGSFFITTFHFG
jgi:hypothetical protein